ncbi:MAG TPA: sulfate adenylyltransferase subunit CysN [Pseudonocardiaceae bacterium]|jgi:bifunctional enzyme CysN/CysC|nr:sulfate adenylyltransferase subunit CysN [Pseudonocardiaceae bacterium]
MSQTVDTGTEQIEEYLRGQQNVDLLRFITCGSVDDGKSTLTGRLLYESHMIFADQLAALAGDSAVLGTQGDELDLALLVDGLAAEREQGITIDVAYRFFATDRRRFIVADAPGHEQYTRNMVTGASTADLAVILVDATKGVLTQTRRHSYVTAMLGIRHVVLAVNKLDAVDYDRSVFDGIVRDYRAFADRIGLTGITCVPTSALHGDNIVTPSPHTPWYRGPTVLTALETAELDGTAAQRRPFRLPVQLVSRPDPHFRGVCGPVIGGRVRPGDEVRVLPSDRTTRIVRVVASDGDLPEAVAGESVTVTLADELDVSRGDLLCAADSPATVADRFEATVIWMGEDYLLPGRPYRIKIGTRVVDGTVTELHHQIDVNSMARLPAGRLEFNQIGLCTVRVDREVAFDPYTDNRDTGGFILIDRTTNTTVGAGLLTAALTPARNLHWQDVDVDKATRSLRNGHRPCVVWLTGLSGAGKSAIANLLERRLHTLGAHTYLLDGDNVRHGLNRDLGFTEAGRVENIRRVAEVAALMVDAGLIVLAAFISPFRADRDMARRTVAPGEFCEVFVDTPLAVAEQRDPKGLYRKARRGDLANFTGIDSPYEAPLDPDVHLDTTRQSPEDAVEAVIDWLRVGGLLS